MIHEHLFIPSNKKGYEVCVDCGTYHSIELLPPDEVYNNYWGDGTNRSTLEQQCDNMLCTDDCGISKIDRVLQFIPKRGKNFLEIGCAPGVLLDKMLDRNFDVFGIEPSINYIDFICKKAPNARVVHGYFPEVTKESNPDIFDCIVAMDVAEHINDYDAFFKEVHRLLIPKGRAIIMSPIILKRDNMIKDSEFLPAEHAWLWTEVYLDKYLKTIFSEVKFTRWINGHEMIILDK